MFLLSIYREEDEGEERELSTVKVSKTVWPGIGWRGVELYLNGNGVCTAIESVYAFIPDEDDEDEEDDSKGVCTTRKSILVWVVMHSA